MRAYVLLLIVFVFLYSATSEQSSYLTHFEFLLDNRKSYLLIQVRNVRFVNLGHERVLHFELPDLLSKPEITTYSVLQKEYTLSLI